MSIKHKINALRSKTTAAGCTEAEALAAAELAQKLMANHNLTADDLAVGEARIGSIKKVPIWHMRLMSAVSIATNTAPLHTIGTNVYVSFHGRAPGPEIATYLYEVCLGACKRELLEFRKSQFYKRRRTAKTRSAASADFLTAMANRLSARVVQLFQPHYNEADRQMAIRARDNGNPNCREMKANSRDVRFSEAATAGWMAGARPALNGGVGSNEPKAMLK